MTEKEQADVVLSRKVVFVRCCPNTKIENVRIMPSEYTLRYVLINHEMDFVFCVSIMSVSVLALVLIFTLRSTSSLTRQGIYLFLFFILTGLWDLGMTGILYIMINNNYLCSNLEYYAMFLMPVPFCAFLSHEYENKARIIFRLMAVFFGIFGIEVIIINITTVYHFYWFTHIERILLGIGLVVTALILIFKHEKNSLNEHIIRIGTICSIVVMTIEVVRIELKDTSYLFRKLFSTSLAVFGIMIFVFSLLYGYYAKLSSDIRHKRRLEQVAYTDGTTGISNRTAVISFMNRLENTADYGLVFFDVNDLKKANDIYGHETGDLLISVVAQALQESFSEGFFGRYGGDEFVAGYDNDSEKKISESIEKFDSIILDANKNKKLPFEINVAYGWFINDPSSPVDPEQGLKATPHKERLTA